MPIKSDVDWEEVGKAAVPTLLPIGVMGLGWYYCSKRKDQELWFKALKKPSWIIDDQQITGALGTLAVAPIGYAAYLIGKEAGSTERQVAMGLYGAGLLASVAGIPAYAHTKDLSCWFGVSFLTAGLFGATAIAFYKLNETAGLLLAPLALWSAYGAVSMFATMQNNPNAGTDWTPKK